MYGATDDGGCYSSEPQPDQLAIESALFPGQKLVPPAARTDLAALEHALDHGHHRHDEAPAVGDVMRHVDLTPGDENFIELVKLLGLDWLERWPLGSGFQPPAREKLLIWPPALTMGGCCRDAGLGRLLRSLTRRSCAVITMSASDTAPYTRRFVAPMMRVWLILAVGCGSAPVQEPRAPMVDRCSDLASCEDACTRGVVDGCDDAAKRMQASPDETDAARYAAVLARSCEAGRPAACLSLVEVVKYAPALPVDEARASALNRRACELGDGIACIAVSNERKVDDGQFAALHYRAISLLEAKCRAHDSKSCIARWALYAAEAPDGETTRTYREHAADDLERGCLAGAGPECTGAAMMVIAAVHEQDIARATRLLERGCSMGEIEACVRIGKNADYDNPTRAREALRISCDGGREDGCLALASMTEDMTLLERGIRIARAGCALGNDRPCESLVKILNLHAIPPAELGQTADLIERVCRRGLAVLCHNLARTLDASSDPLHDIVRVTSLEQAACDGGYKVACPAEVEVHPRFGVVILDRRTGLEWAPVFPSEGTRAEAIRFCALLDGNYRLPTNIELETLVERNSDVRPFARATLPREGLVFSSEVVNGDGDAPWSMDIRKGHIVNGKGNRGYARCVRQAPTGKKLAISKKRARVKPSVLHIAVSGSDLEYSLEDAAGKAINAATVVKVAVPPYASPYLRYAGATVRGPVDVDVASGVDWELVEKFLASAKEAGLELVHVAIDGPS